MTQGLDVVILDGYTTNPGDISWDGVKMADFVNSFTVYDRTAKEDITARAYGCNALLTNKTVLTKECLEKLPKLKYVGLLSTGVNVVDIKYCDERGIAITNIPGYSTDSVAQMVFSYITLMCFHADIHSASVHSGSWADAVDFTYRLTPLTELRGKVLGIIGYGAIGKKVAEIGRAFGMKIKVTGRRVLDIPEYDTAENVFAQSDFISLHCPLTDENKEMINSKTIALMKKSAFVINTARGGLVNEADAACALNSGCIAGFAADVLSTEPPKHDNPLLTAANTIITPHIAWSTVEARRRLINIVKDNLEAFNSFCISGDKTVLKNCVNINSCRF